MKSFHAQIKKNNHAYNLTPFGELSRKIRIERGMMMSELAKSIGVSPSYLCDMEIGKKRLDKDVADKIINILARDITEREYFYEFAKYNFGH